MATIGNNSAARALAKKLKPKFRVIEIVFVSAALAGIALKVAFISIYTPILVISFSALAMLYYLMGVTPSPEGTKFFDSFITKVAFFASAVAIIGILFCIQNYRSAATSLYVGSVSLAIAVIYSLVKIQTDFVKANRNMVLRSIILLLICIGLISTPKEQLYAIHLLYSLPH